MQDIDTTPTGWMSDMSEFDREDDEGGNEEGNEEEDQSDDGEVEG
jgi:hypothetical protein